MHNFNLSLLGKWIWKFKDINDNSLWKEMISNRYYNGSFNLYQVTPNVNKNYSTFWGSILKCHDTFKLGIDTIVHSGNNTSFWHDSWISAIPLKVEFKELFDVSNFKNALIKDVVTSSGSILGISVFLEL